MRDGVADPAAGMQVIRRALTMLYSGEVVDIGSSTELVEHLPKVLNRALEGASCPFQTHEESLVAFARAIYALRLDGGRCTAPGTPAGCGFYDPNDLYYAPPVSTIAYTGAGQQYAGEIESSFGMDFVELVLDPAADGQPLTLEFYGAPGAKANFNVQLWKLMDSDEGVKSRRALTHTTAVEALAEADADGHLSYVIPAIDTSATNRLGLIITRVDAKESSDPAGTYTVVLQGE